MLQDSCALISIIYGPVIVIKSVDLARGEPKESEVVCEIHSRTAHPRDDVTGRNRNGKLLPDEHMLHLDAAPCTALRCELRM